jgi:hypothetical protein
MTRMEWIESLVVKNQDVLRSAKTE